MKYFYEALINLWFSTINPSVLPLPVTNQVHHSGFSSSLGMKIQTEDMNPLNWPNFQVNQSSLSDKERVIQNFSPDPFFVPMTLSLLLSFSDTTINCFSFNLL